MKGGLVYEWIRTLSSKPKKIGSNLSPGKEFISENTIRKKYIDK